MGTIAEKLTRLNETKKDIYNAIVHKNVEIHPLTPFKDYADKILNIKGEESNQNEDVFITDDMQFCIDLLSKPERLVSTGALLFFSYSNMITSSQFTIGGYNNYKVETADGVIYQSDDTKNTTPIEHRWDVSKTPKSLEGKGHILWAIIYTNGPKVDLPVSYYQFVYLKNTKMSFRNLSNTSGINLVFSCGDENSCYLIENGADSGSYLSNSVRAVKYLSITDVDYTQYAKKTDKEYLKYLYLKRLSVTGEYGVLFPDFIEHLSLLDSAPKPGISSFLKARTFKSLTIPSFGTLTSLNGMFSNWKNLKQVDLNCAGIQNMTSVFEGCYALEKVKFENTESVNDMTNLFKSCYALKAITGLEILKAMPMSGLFDGCHSLEIVPELDTSKASTLACLFRGCWSLVEVTNLDTSGISIEAERPLEYLFTNCCSLVKAPFFAIPGTYFGGVFLGCTALKEVPLYDTHLVDDINRLFVNCASLEAIPNFNTSNVTNMDYVFSGCTALKEVPLWDTEKVISLDGAFNGCLSLMHLPLLDTGNVTSMSNTFRDCKALETIPVFDLQKLEEMSITFKGCSALKIIPEVDVNQVTQFYATFDGCTSLESIKMKNIGVSLDISASTKFTSEALVTVVNNLKSVSTQQTLTMGEVNLAKLTDEQKAIATSKGWTLA